MHLPIDYIIGKGYNKDEKLYRFAQLFAAKSLEEAKKICEGDDEFMSVYEKMESLTKDPNFLLYYNWEEEQEMLRIGSEKYAREQGFEKGKVEGFEIGKAEGQAEGRAEGRAEGIEQGKESERNYLIYNMISNGMKKEDISKYTNIPIDLIKEMEARENPYANTR